MYWLLEIRARAAHGQTDGCVLSRQPVRPSRRGNTPPSAAVRSPMFLQAVAKAMCIGAILTYAGRPSNGLEGPCPQFPGACRQAFQGATRRLTAARTLAPTAKLLLRSFATSWSSPHPSNLSRTLGCPGGGHPCV